MRKSFRVPAPVIILLSVSLLAAAFVLYGAVRENREKMMYPLKFEKYVEAYSEEYGVPREIIYSVICTESGFRADAVSSAGAVGLMQLTNDTYEWLCYLQKEENVDVSKLTQPDTNIKYGVYFLSYLYKKFESWDTVFAAYNAGVNRVSGWLSDSRYSDGNKLTFIPYKETEAYVIKVNNAIEKYKKIYDM